MPIHRESAGVLTVTLTILAAVYFVAFNAVAIYYVGPHGWDDGAIILAYGQSLARHGRFSLNGASEIVEGASSILSVLAASLWTSTCRPAFHQHIAIAQFEALAFAALGAVALYAMLSKTLSNRWVAALSSLVTFSIPMFSSDIINGMEMSLFALLMLLFVKAFESRGPAVFLLVPAILLTRFEGIFYLFFALFLVAATAEAERRRGWMLLLYTLACFAIIEAARFAYFGSLVPNTIAAKLHAPYAPTTAASWVLHKLRGLDAFIGAHGLVMLAIALFGSLAGRRKVSADALLVGLGLAFLLFAVGAGRTSGFPGRVTLACFPILVLLMFRLAARASDVRIVLGDGRVMSLDRKALVALGVLVLLLSFVSNLSAAVDNVTLIVRGGYHQNLFLPAFIKARVKAQVRQTASVGVSPENFRITGLTVDRLRDAAALDRIRFLTPDVGGLGLCCDRVQVLDSAMLTNGELARSGYPAFERFLSKYRPQVVETHGLWSATTGIYDHEYFGRHYKPAIVDGTLLWLDQQFLHRLGRCGVRLDAVATSTLSPSNTRYLESDIDQVNLRTRFPLDVVSISLATRPGNSCRED